MKIVLFPAFDPARLQLVTDTAGLAHVVNTSDVSAARDAIRDADGFIGKITPSLLLSSTRLRWIQAPTAALEHYMFPELVTHPAVLTNMRGIHADPIADQVMGYVLSFARNLHLYVRYQSEHRWSPVGGEDARVTDDTGQATVTAMDRATFTLQSATLGVVGLGSIGRAVARRAVAFGLRIVAVDLRTDDVPSFVSHVWGVGELDRLLEVADFVVIAAPQTPETVHLFDRTRLRKMKEGAFLINVGRGAIVVLDDLVDALRKHVLAGVALDVFETEPLPASHPLWTFENVIITPHVAGYAASVADRHLAIILENIRRFQGGQTLLNVVDKASWC